MIGIPFPHGTGGGGQPPDPSRIYVGEKLLTATEIVGNAEGTLGHSKGVLIVPGVPGKVLLFHHARITGTFDTAAYGDGGNLAFRYGPSWGAAVVSTSMPADKTFGNSGDWTAWAGTNGNSLTSVSNGNAWVGAGFTLASASPFTNPGTAAGTALVKVFYSIVDP